MSQREIMNPAELADRTAQLARAMGDMIPGPENALLLGIRTGGAVLATRVRDILLETRGWDIPLGHLDINLYRDDLSRLDSHPLVRGTEIPVDLEGRIVLLIDDVLYTGRTIRSALDAIGDFGRPLAVRLGVLVDRGLREYPIRADFAALTIDSDPGESVEVLIRDGGDPAAERVVLTGKDSGGAR